MAFVDIKCLESLLIEGKELSIANESNETIADDSMLVDYILPKIVLRHELNSPDMKKYKIDSNCIYVIKLCQSLYNNKVSSTNFEKCLSDLIIKDVPVQINDDFYKSVKNIILKDNLIYIGSHQSIAFDLFYNSTKHLFYLIDIEHRTVEKYSYNGLIKLTV